MKNILLATTFLVATTGFAAAEISFGGSAAAGIATNGLDNGGLANPDGSPDETYQTYSFATLDVMFTGETDSGLTFGADFGLTTGKAYYLADDDGFADEAGDFGMASIWVDGAYGKLTIADDDFDFFDDTNGGGDIMYEGTFGAITVGLIADVDADAFGDPNFSLALDYAAGALSAHADVDTYEIWNVSAGYTFGSFTATIGTNEVEDHFIKGEYSANGIGAFAQYNAVDDGNQWEIGGSYARNGLSVEFTYDEGENYEVLTSFDLGGGLSLEAGANDTGDVMLGAAMSF